MVCSAPTENAKGVIFCYEGSEEMAAWLGLEKCTGESSWGLILLFIFLGAALFLAVYVAVRKADSILRGAASSIAMPYELNCSQSHNSQLGEVS